MKKYTFKDVDTGTTYEFNEEQPTVQTGPKPTVTQTGPNTYTLKDHTTGEQFTVTESKPEIKKTYEPTEKEKKDFLNTETARLEAEKAAKVTEEKKKIPTVNQFIKLLDDY